MILYLDASALVKLYIAERGSAEVVDWIKRSEFSGTAQITQVEVSAALARAVRMSILSHDNAMAALKRFHLDWDGFQRLLVTEIITVRGGTLAWDYGLRGYDAVHLATALNWQDTIGEPVTLATFDRQLWDAGRLVGMGVLPETL